MHTRSRLPLEQLVALQIVRDMGMMSYMAPAATVASPLHVSRAMQVAHAHDGLHAGRVERGHGVGRPGLCGAIMTRADLERAFACCRMMWFAAGQPMDRATSPLRCRYVHLWNLLAHVRRFGEFPTYQTRVHPRPALRMGAA